MALSFSLWKLGGDATLGLVNALVDRITHKAKIVNMTGMSFRLKQNVIPAQTNPGNDKKSSLNNNPSSESLYICKPCGWHIFE